MSKPYDATSKELIETDPAGWVAFLGCQVASTAVGLLDADVSTVTTDADKVIRIDGPEPWLLHLDIQTGWDPTLGRRLLRYNALLHHRHALPVASVLVILRSDANVSALTGVLPIRPPVGTGWEFRYDVIRVWERPASDFLNAPLGLLPLAPLAKIRAADLPAIVNEMRNRIDGQPDRSLAAKLWAATYVLLGLRFDQELIDNVLLGVIQMEESVTYQAILRRGMQQGIQQGTQHGAALEGRKMLLIAGQERFGQPNAQAEAAIGAITDPAQLESLLKKVFKVSTWDDLLKAD